MKSAFLIDRNDYFGKPYDTERIPVKRISKQIQNQIPTLQHLILTFEFLA